MCSLIIYSYVCAILLFCAQKKCTPKRLPFGVYVFFEACFYRNFFNNYLLLALVYNTGKSLRGEPVRQCIFVVQVYIKDGKVQLGLYIITYALVHIEQYVY